MDKSIIFASVYPLDVDLSGGYRYPLFEQPRPGCWRKISASGGTISLGVFRDGNPLLDYKFLSKR